MYSVRKQWLAYDCTAVNLRGAAYANGRSETYPQGKIVVRWETIDFGVPYHERWEVDEDETRGRQIISVPPQEWPHIGVMTFLALFPDWLRLMDGVTVPCLRMPAVCTFGVRHEPGSWDEVNQCEGLSSRSTGGILTASLGRQPGEKRLGFHGDSVMLSSDLLYVLPRLVSHT
jgi:hypothetical protein